MLYEQILILIYLYFILEEKKINIFEDRLFVKMRCVYGRFGLDGDYV